MVVVITNHFCHSVVICTTVCTLYWCAVCLVLLYNLQITFVFASVYSGHFHFFVLSYWLSITMLSYPLLIIEYDCMLHKSHIQWSKEDKITCLWVRVNCRTSVLCSCKRNWCDVFFCIFMWFVITRLILKLYWFVVLLVSWLVGLLGD